MEFTPANLDALRARGQKLGLTDRAVNYFTADVFAKLQTKEPTPRQWEALVKAVDRAERQAQREAEWDAERQAKVDAGVTCESGTGTFVAEVLSVKWWDKGAFPATKMTVEVTEGPAKGVRLWGTLPRALDTRWDDGPGGTNEEFPQAQRGDVVRFTATVTPSDEDQTFGFFKRPRAAEFVSRVADEEGEDTLGPCGCSDYHYADCPTRGGVYA